MQNDALLRTDPAGDLKLTTPFVIGVDPLSQSNTVFKKEAQLVSVPLPLSYHAAGKLASSCNH